MESTKKPIVNLKDKIVYTPTEAALMTGISENVIRSLCERGTIKAFRNGKNWKISANLLREKVDQLCEEKATVNG